MICLHRAHITAALVFLLLGVRAASAADAPTATEHSLVNGNFAEADAQGFPTGWFCPVKSKGAAADAGEAKSPRDVKYEVISANKESYLCATFTDKGTTPIAQVIKVPSHAKEAIIMVKVRGTSEPVIGEPIVGCLLFDKSGKTLNTSHHDDFQAVKKLRAKGWVPLQLKFKIVPSSSLARIYLGQLHAVAASFDFKDVEVRFR